MVQPVYYQAVLLTSGDKDNTASEPKIPCSIVWDLDGCLFNPNEYVMQYLKGRVSSMRDWDGYFRHTLEFPAIPSMVELALSLCKCGDRITWLTARPEYNRSLTEQALHNLKVFDKFKIPLIMKPNTMEDVDNAEFKVPVIKALQPNLVVEDDPKTVKAVMEAGFMVLQVCGNRATSEDDWTPPSKAERDKLKADKFREIYGGNVNHEVIMDEINHGGFR